MAAHAEKIQSLTIILIGQDERLELTSWDMLGIMRINLFHFWKPLSIFRAGIIDIVFACAFQVVVCPFSSELSDFPTLFVFSHYHFCRGIIYSKSWMSKLNWQFFTSHKSYKFFSGLNKCKNHLMRDFELFLLCFGLIHFWKFFCNRINY